MQIIPHWDFSQIVLDATSWQSTPTCDCIQNILLDLVISHTIIYFPWTHAVINQACSNLQCIYLCSPVPLTFLLTVTVFPSSHIWLAGCHWFFFISKSQNLSPKFLWVVVPFFICSCGLDFVVVQQTDHWTLSM